MLVSGGTGSGKTTTLNALSGAIPGEERIVTIEDAAELRLRQRHVVRLEARPANLEGRGEVTIRRLVRNALRMRPDRIVVGEVRGAEALDMLQALNTGHDGSLTTVHANSPEDALRRVETLALMAGVGLPHGAVREQVASALDLVVHQARADRSAPGSSSRSREVVRVAGGAGTRDLYRRGGELRRPGPGPLAGRLEALDGGGGGVLSPAALLAFVAAAARRRGERPARWAAPGPLAERGPRLARGAAGLVDVLVRLGREGRRRAPPSGAGCCWPGRSAAFLAGTAVAGPLPGLLLAAAGPWTVARVLRARRRRYRRAVDAGVAQMAVALADALGGGHSLRGALAEARRRRRRAGGARAAPRRRRAGGGSDHGRGARGHACPRALGAARRARGRLPPAAARRRRPCAAAARERTRDGGPGRGSRTRSRRPPPRRASRA